MPTPSCGSRGSADGRLLHDEGEVLFYLHVRNMGFACVCVGFLNFQGAVCETRKRIKRLPWDLKSEILSLHWWWKFLFVLLFPLFSSNIKKPACPPSDSVIHRHALHVWRNSVPPIAISRIGYHLHFLRSAGWKVILLLRSMALWRRMRENWCCGIIPLLFRFRVCAADWLRSILMPVSLDFEKITYRMGFLRS